MISMNVAVTKGNKRWMGWSIHAAGAVALFLTSLLYALPAGAAPGRPAIRSGNPVDGNPPVSTANLATDKARYAPGQVVQITGSGFAPSESVKLRIALQSNLKSGSQNLDAWTVAAPNGAITTQWVIPAGYINDSLVVAATGTASGEWGLAGFTSANTNLTLSSALRDTLCGSAGDSIDVCVTLTQSCNRDPDQPLPGREVIFFVNPGDCGVNVGQAAEDTAITDASGIACDRLAIPLAPGTYTLRAKFRGEDPPDPCPLPGNNACDPNDGDANKRCTNLSSANLCQKFEANTPCCGNRPPVTFAPPDFAISACEGDTICTFPWSETDPDGNIMSFFIPFGFMPASGRICFVVDTAGVYQIICCAVDACGLQGCDTMYVTVTLNRKPDIALGNDTTFVLCSSVPICLPYTVSDPDGLAGLTEYLVWGPPGATIDTALNKVCFTPTVSGKDTVIVTVTDHCGAVDSDTIVINALLNHPPTIDLGPDKTITQCTQAPICCFYSVADPDGLDGLIESLISGPPNASIDTAGNKVCFTPTASGDYSIIVRVIDPCDQADYDTSVVHVTLNGPPDIAFGNDSTIVQCTPSQICAPYTISDPNELGHLTEMLLSGPPAARLDTLNNKVCFTPTISGIYTIIAKVSDSCGAEDRDTINFTVTVNGPPTIDLGADKNIAQCTAGQICCPYTVSDPNGLGKLSEFLIAGPSGAFIDTLNNKICFTPTGSGCQTIIAKAIDSCGVNDYDTTVVCVTLNAPPDIAFGHDSTLTQCTPVQICASYTISDPNGLSHLSELLLSGPPAAFLDTLNNKVCFTPSGSGAYTIIAKVTDSCGAEDRDTIVYTINQGTPPSIDLGPDQNAIQCAASAICVTYTVSGSQPLTEALVSGPANASIDTVANKICFTPAGSGCNTIIAKVTNGCGASDLDTVVVCVTVNGPPTIDFGADKSIFLCASAPVCVPYTISDPNGLGKLTESLISGTGVTIDTANNKVCFTPTATGCRTIIAKVTDACGAGDYDTISVCVNFNRPPFVIGPADTSVRICLGDTICRGPWIEGDLDHNIVLVQVPFGFIHGASICFVPDTSGTYSLIDCDVDSCGVKVCDTVKVTVDVNDPPNVTGPPDTTVWLCRVPASICVGPFGFSDPDHNIKTKSVNKGTLANDTVCYTATTGAPDTIIVTVIDSCGVVDKDTVIVTKTLNQPPVCNFLPVAPSICANAEFILPFTDVDPEGGATSCVLYGPGILSGNLYRYTPLGGETIHVIIRCKDACGDSCSIEFTTTFKSKQPPVCILPRDTTIFQCAPSQACLPVTATSLNPPVICKVVGGPGAVTNGNWCYTPTGEQSVDVTIRCTDACSTSCEGTFHVAFDMNDPPLIVLGNDTSVTLCNPPVPVCVGYSVSDPNGPRKLTESLFSGPAGASIDTVANKICFTPTVTGNYTIIAKVTDSCGAFDLDTIVVTVIPAVPPVCYLPTDQTYNRCAPAQVCLAVSATGDHKPTCALISGPGALAQGAWCYTPSGVDTSFTVTIRCTDTCGAFCEGSFHVTYKFNKLAQINFGRDTSVFQCTLTPICVPYTVTDPDGLAGIIETLVSGPPSATIDTAGNKICFTPTASGSYTIIAREEEPCYFVDYDTIVVTVTLNSPPVIDLGVDKTVFLCATAPICVPYTVSDPNGLGKLGEHLLSGPAGTAIDTAGNKVCFTPGTSGNFTIVVIVTDACGAFDMDTAVVHVTYNGPPTIDFGSDQSVTLCTPSQICAPYVVSDPNGPGKLTDMLLSGPPAAFLDTLNRRVCFTPGSSGTYTIIAKVTDSCGSEDRDTVVYTVTLNSPPKIVLGPDQTVQQCTPAQICVTYTVSDPNGFSKLTESLASGPAGATIDTAANMICFTPTGTGFFTIMANVTDSCQFTDADTVVIIVVPGQDCECRIRVSINGGTQLDVLNGETVTVPILIDHTNALLGGYDFLLCFDPTGVNFVTAQKGSVIPNWEYFTYRLGTRGDCGIGCPSGLIRIIGIADMNNGSSHPPAEEFLPDGVIATIKFLVTTDRNFIGQCLPIRFCWLDCGDNTISDKTGDTTFIGVGVRYDTCQSQAKVNPISAICFTDGQICIQEPPDDRGDVNLNGIANEVGDAVLYTNYFIYGDKVWNPVYKAAQLLASDVNDDGIVLTVADLIFLIRIITGDQQPLLPGGNPKILALDPAHVVATVADGALQLGWQSDVAVGGAHFVIDVPSDAEIGTPALTPDVADMEIRSNLEGNQLRVLVYSRTARQIPAGRHTVVTIPMTNAARASVSTYDLSTGDGEVLPATLAHGAPLPTGFNLQQNYPNPFNAGTVIRFGLDQPGPYSVSIYDITGRRIWYSEGETAGGWVEVRWDGRNDNGVQLASGIYLYRVQTQQGIQIKKMTLLK